MHRRIRPLLATLATVALLAATPLVTDDEAAAKSKPSHQARGYDILFVRHAHSTYPPPEQELSAQGIEQAAALTASLKEEPIDAVYTSMMLRSFQTGDEVAADHDVPVLADEDLNEVDFSIPSDLPPAEQLAHYREIMEKWLNGEERDNAFGGESYPEIEARWSDWWDDFVREHRTDDGTAMVVAHGGIYGLMLPATCSNEITPAFALANPLANTGTVKARLHPDGSLTCTEWNGVPVPSAS